MRGQTKSCSYSLSFGRLLKKYKIAVKLLKGDGHGKPGYTTTHYGKFAIYRLGVGHVKFHWLRQQNLLQRAVQPGAHTRDCRSFYPWGRRQTGHSVMFCDVG